MNTLRMPFARFLAVTLLALATSAGAAPTDDRAQVDALSSRSTLHDRKIEALERSLREQADDLRAARARTESLARAHEERLRQLDDRLRRLDSGVVRTAERIERGEKRVDGALDELREQQVGTEQRLVGLLTSRTAGIGLAIVLITLAGIGAFFAIRRSLNTAKSGLGARAEEALSSIRSAEERLAQADTRLVEALTEQLAKVRQAAAAGAPHGGAPTADAPTVDHTLAIRLADELHRMRRRLASLPEDTKGVTPLRRSIERLEAELAEHGYDLVDHSGRPFIDGLTVEARFVPDESLAPGQRVISKVLAPQVNYRGTLVRMAEVEVGIGG